MRYQPNSLVKPSSNESKLIRRPFSVKNNMLEWPRNLHRSLSLSDTIRLNLECKSSKHESLLINPPFVDKKYRMKKHNKLDRSQSLSESIHPHLQYDPSNESKSTNRPFSAIRRSQSHSSGSILSTLQRKKKKKKSGKDFLHSSTGYTILHRACRKKKTTPHTIAFILKSDLDMAMVQDKIQGYTPLHIAALKSSLSVVKALIGSCPTAAEVQDTLGRTPLHLACKRGSYAIMKEILNARPKNVLMKDSEGETPLLHSLSKEKCESIPLELLKLCPKSALSLDKNGDTPLRRAYVNRKSLKVLKSILKAEPSVAKITNNEGESFMDYFFRVYAKSSRLYNIYDLTCILLRAGTNAPIQVSKIDDIINVGSPWLPLHSCALMNCPLPLFRLFLKSCPDQSKIFDKKGDLPIHIAVRKIKYYNSMQVNRSNLSSKKGQNFRSKMKNNFFARANNENKIPRNTRKSLSRRQVRPKRQDRTSNAVTELVAMYPQGASISDRQGRLPLCVAAENGLFWSEGLQHIYEAAPRALLTRDTRTHMHPFMLSAIRKESTNKKQKKKSKEEDLQHLTTTYELLQRSFHKTYSNPIQLFYP